MNYGNIKECDIADGPGVRVSLFVSGCRHHCKGCFNEETWNFNYWTAIHRRDGSGNIEFRWILTSFKDSLCSEGNRSSRRIRWNW